jgi:cell division septum initiation protein DivIVA
VVPGLEDPEEWEAHRQGIWRSLAPEGQLEEALTELVASLLWRLNRVTRFETQSISLEQEAAVDTLLSESRVRLSGFGRYTAPTEPEGAQDTRELAQAHLCLLQRLTELSDETPLSGEEATVILASVAARAPSVYAETLSVPGMPPGVALEDYPDWTVGLVRAALTAIVEHARKAPDVLLEEAVRHAQWEADEADDMADHVTSKITRLRRERLLPDGSVLDKVMRYEAHLSRLVRATLHDLEALQSRRAGQPSPLARIDITGLPER